MGPGSARVWPRAAALLYDCADGLCRLSSPRHACWLFSLRYHHPPLHTWPCPAPPPHTSASLPPRPTPVLCACPPTVSPHISTMAYIGNLKPTILAILHASDLGSVSTKDVRAALLENPQYSKQVPASLSVDGADRHEINGLIKTCFAEIQVEQASNATPTAPVAPAKRGRKTKAEERTSGSPLIPSLLLPSRPLRSRRARLDVARCVSCPSHPRILLLLTASSCTCTAAADGPQAKKQRKRRPATPESKARRAAHPNNAFSAPLILDEPLAALCEGNDVRLLAYCDRDRKNS